jgi:hypothetical protein
MVQGNRNHRTRVKRILLSSLDEVKGRLDNADDVHRQEPASVKNMLKGDATWATRKIVLGWMLDTCAMTIQLPAPSPSCHPPVRTLVFHLADATANNR